MDYIDNNSDLTAPALSIMLEAERECFTHAEWEAIINIFESEAHSPLGKQVYNILTSLGLSATSPEALRANRP